MLSPPLRQTVAQSATTARSSIVSVCDRPKCHLHGGRCAGCVAGWSARFWRRWSSRRSTSRRYGRSVFCGLWSSSPASQVSTGRRRVRTMDSYMIAPSIHNSMVRTHWTPSTASTIAMLSLSFTPNLITAILSTINSMSLGFNYPDSSRSRSVLLVLSLKLVSSIILLPPYTLSSLAHDHWTHRIQALLTYLQSSHKLPNLHIFISPRSTRSSIIHRYSC